ncbi:GNAT family N-acetyltransferase [Fictibacillus nanhaiensis]|uniref:GNAT family N-acetyltransferase n=1 Tax=Fictibacillus nanhaiensis TaxID=742169 RepID=UPI003C195673
MIRDYEPGDEKGIQILFKEVFKKDRSIKEWYWKYTQNPYKKPIIKIWDEDEIAGHVSLVPFAAKWFKEEVTFGARLDTMVSQKHRGKKIYPKLNERLFKQAPEKGFDFLFGFPAELAKKLLIRDSGAKVIGAIPRLLHVNKFSNLLLSKFPMLRPISPIIRFIDGMRKPARINNQNGEFKKIDVCGLEFNELWEKVKDDYPILLKRDAAFLNWRYHERPDFSYTMYGYYRNDSLIGYVVVNEQSKPFSKGSITVGVIVDILGINEQDVWHSLIKKGKDVLSNSDIINTWALKHTVLYKELKKASFVHKDEPMSLVGKSVSSSIPNKDEGFNINNWFITPGDVDSF